MASAAGAQVRLLELAELDIPMYNADLECWLAPRSFALAGAASAFDAEGALVQEDHRSGVQAVVDQVLWAAKRLHA